MDPNAPGLHNPTCIMCTGHTGAYTPFMQDEVVGTFPTTVMFISEAPSATDDAQGRPMTGKSGSMFREFIESYVKDYPEEFRNYVITNAVICRPPDGKLSKDGHEVEACKGHLLRRIKQYRPKLIVTLGATPLTVLMGKMSIMQSHGSSYLLPYKFGDLQPTVYPVFNPAATFYAPNLLDDFIKDMNLVPSVLRTIGSVKVEPTIHVLDTIEKIRWALDKCLASGMSSWDTETGHPVHGGLDPYRSAKLICMQFAWDDMEGGVIPWDYWEYGFKYKWSQVERKQIIRMLIEFFQNPNHKVVFHNAKFDMIMMEALLAGARIKNLYGDTMLAQYTLDEREERNLGYLCRKYLGVYDYKEGPDEWLKANGHKKTKTGMWYVPEEVLFPYGAKDSIYTRLLHPIMEAKIRNEGFEDIYFNQFVYDTRAIVDMAHAGMKVGEKEWQTAMKEFEERLVAVDQKLHTFPEVVQLEVDTGSKAKWTASRFVGKLLYDRLGLPVTERTAKTNEPKVTKYILDQLSQLHEIPKRILGWRRVYKNYSTYVRDMPKHVDSNWLIRPDYRGDGTKSGRLSAKAPPIQQIPWDRRIKGQFVSRFGEHGIMLQSDYSQIELRIMAALSQDPKMVEGFNSGFDFHQYTAGKIYRVPFEQVEKWQRRYTKTVNFGIPYGRGAKSMLGQFNLPEHEAMAIVDGWKSEFNIFWRMRTEMINKARRDGFIISAMGQRRWIPEFRSSDRSLQNYAEHVAINSPIQGDAAKICRRAQGRANAILKDNDARSVIVGNIHDAIIFDIYLPELDWVQSWLRPTVTQTDFIPWFRNVPLEVDIKTGEFWGAWDVDMASILDSGLVVDDDIVEPDAADLDNLLNPN